MNKLLYIALFLLLFTGCTTEVKTGLNDFVYEQQELPDNCEIKGISPEDNLPCDSKQNPFISSDSIFINCFVYTLTEDIEISAQVKTALYSIYQGYGEIGLFGFELTTEQAANDLVILIEEMGTFTQGNIYQSAELVIILWNDMLRDEVFPEFRKLIEKSLGQ